jgi:hypothetical protein
MMISRYSSASVRLASRLSPVQWWLVAIPLLVIRQVTQQWLDGLYTLSQFPVPFFVGQTTFNAAELKGYYAVLLEQGTLDRYMLVQIADYAFMLTVMISFFALMAAIYRSIPKWPALMTIARCMLVIAPLAAIFDALENAVSFVMLANPTGFSDWLVYPYSSLAVMKFAVFVLSYLWSLIALVIIFLTAIYRHFTATTRSHLIK